MGLVLTILLVNRSSTDSTRPNHAQSLDRQCFSDTITTKSFKSNFLSLNIKRKEKEKNLSPHLSGWSFEVFCSHRFFDSFPIFFPWPMFELTSGVWFWYCSLVLSAGSMLWRWHRLIEVWEKNSETPVFFWLTGVYQSAVYFFLFTLLIIVSCYRWSVKWIQFGGHALLIVNLVLLCLSERTRRFAPL